MTTARLLRYAALAFATVGLLCTVLPGLLIEDHLIPTLLCGSGAICAIAAIRGRASWSWHALGACLGALAVALIVQGANRSTVSAVVASGLFAGMLQNGTSLAFASLGGLFSERSGVTNIGLEGMLLTGCFTAFWACEKSGSWIVGVLAAGLVSGVLALVHAVFAIHLQADQIVTGTAVNILAAGGTAFAYRAIYGTSDAPNLDRVPEIGGLSGVPLIGGVITGQSVLTWVVVALIVATWFLLFRTPWGLRLRAVGENPRAADTVGIRVFRTRYIAVALSGVLAGVGGAYLSIGFGGAFTEGMSGGRGFIALAAVILGKWRPFGVAGACLLFGFSEKLGDQLQTSAGISSAFASILPYALTLVALVGLVGRSVPPRSVGIPYKRQ